MLNVYDAARQRIEYIFDEFGKITVAFSGGKDSGVVLNLAIDEARKRKRKIGVMFIDIEAHYRKTVDFAQQIIDENLDVLEPQWICLPMLSNNSLSYTELTWSWWEPDKKELWVRDMPTMDYVINLNNNPIGFYEPGITFEEFVVKYGKWYSQGEKTAVLLGIRTQESLNRWRAINIEKTMYKDKKYSTKVHENVYNFYPIYDWYVEDIWIYNGKFEKPYNKLYDLLYQADVSIHKMRVDEPFGNEAKAGLNMFRIIEPDTWNKVVNRVSGANFGNIYSGERIMTGKYKLPPGHTWQSFTQFLLDTLPDEAAEHYKKKFKTFIEYWKNTGCPLPDGTIEFLEKNYGDYIINTKEYGNRGNKDKYLVKFIEVVDEIPELDRKDDLLTWKRMAMAIIKNDYFCKTLSFGVTKEQQIKKKQVLEKYKNIAGIK